MKKKYVILPGCDDNNRGDQALVWETIELSKCAGLNGEYYIVGDKYNCFQSVQEGIEVLSHILPHPSFHFKNKNNIKYGKLIKIKWGLASIIDCLRVCTLLIPGIRKVTYKLMPSDVKKTIDIFKEADVVLVKGGGFLHSYGGLISTYTIFFFLFHIIFALSLKKKVLVMPNSFGPFKAPFTKKMIKSVLGKCHIVMARESISQETLANECGIDSLLKPDLAFYLQKDVSIDWKKEFKKCKIDTSRKTVALTMRPYRFPGKENAQELYEKYVKNMASFIIWLDSKGYHPVLVEHTFAVSEHERDISCIRSVEKVINNKCKYSVFENREINCKELKTIYSHFDYIIGTRFHSIIFSIAELVPAIAITYGGNKGDGIMRDLNLSEYTISIHDVTLEELMSKFNKLVEDNVLVKQKLSDNMIYIKKQKMEIIEEIKKAVMN